MNVTIKDIAQATGLSTATISKYLNNIKIKEENRILIEKTIKQLDYKPNRSAQILRSKKTKTIGILISDLGNYFWGTAITTISSFFMKYNYTVITRSFYFDENKKNDIIQDIISQHFDGVIMLPEGNQDSSYHILQDAGIPVIIMDQLPLSMEQHPVDYVLSDGYKGGLILGQHLLEKGHTNVCILEQSCDSFTIDQRVKGFADAYAQKGYDILSIQPPFPPVQKIGSELTRNQGKQRFRQVFYSKNRPTAIYFTNYITAMGGLMAANSARVSIPEDISFVSFDDDPLFKALYASMTCVSQDLTTIAERSSELLLRRMEGDYSDFPSSVLVDISFHPRKSVKDLTR